MFGIVTGVSGATGASGNFALTAGLAGVIVGGCTYLAGLAFQA